MARSLLLWALMLAGACGTGGAFMPPLTISLSAQAIDASRVDGVSVELRFPAPVSVTPSQQTVTENGFSMTLTAGTPGGDGLLHYRIDVAGNPFAAAPRFDIQVSARTDITAPFVVFATA